MRFTDLPRHVTHADVGFVCSSESVSNAQVCVCVCVCVCVRAISLSLSLSRRWHCRTVPHEIFLLLGKILVIICQPGFCSPLLYSNQWSCDQSGVCRAGFLREVLVWPCHLTWVVSQFLSTLIQSGLHALCMCPF